VPSSPSTARVAAWRGLRALGGVLLGPSVCIVPARLGADEELAAIERRVTSAGGSFDRYVIAASEAETELRWRQRFNEARDAEYAEVAAAARDLVHELQAAERRGYRGIEQREIDIVKLRAALRRVNRRDLFGAAARTDAAAAVERVGALFAALSGEAMTGEAGRTHRSGRGNPPDVDDLFEDLEPSGAG
jgi:hypothetical protein